ncbi:MAG: OmpA family protein [Bacteroidota bacterium]|nr:OmpA family protein [Bacteroidota bacterium]
MKKQIIIGVSLLIFSTLKAQYTKQYLHFDIGGGLNNLEYSLKNGTEKGSFGYSIDAAYSYFFLPNWGLKTGIDLQSYGACSTLNYLSTTRDVDTDGDAYEFRTSYKNWQEKQHALFLEIPLEVQYRHFFNKKIGLLASVGAKVSIPVSADYKTTGGAMVTTGYYSQWNVELSNMPQHGFSTIMNSYSGNLSLKTAYVSIADIGCLFALSKQTNLYLGGYINYGLNNILTPETKQIYQPNRVYNGILVSDQLTKVNLQAVGVKVGLCWQLKDRWKVGIKQSEHAHRYKPVSDHSSSTSVTKQTYSKSKSVNGQNSSKPVINQDSSKPVNVQNSSKLPATNHSSTMPFNEPNSSKPVINQDSSKPVNVQNSSELPATDHSSTMPLNEHNSSKPVINQDSSKLVNERSSFKSTSSSKVKSDPNKIKTLYKKSLKGINFEAGKAVITTKQSYIILDQIVGVLVANPTYLVEVQGHADNEGGSQINRKLSELRAKEVSNYLIRKGIEKKRITTVGYGDTVPISSNETPEGRSANRRVEFVVSFEEVSFK